VNKVCKPLLKGNSKPFYEHLRHKQKCQHPLTSIKIKNGKITTDSLKCAETLNNYFHSQFCVDETITNFPLFPTNSRTLEIYPERVKKLINDLKNNKSPGPDQIRKCELLIDPGIVAQCLTYVFQVSIDSGEHPAQWRTAHVTPVHKKGPKTSHQTIAQSLSPASLVKC